VRGSHSPQIIAKYETCILDDVLAGWVDPDRGKEPGGASQDRAQGPGDPQGYMEELGETDVRAMW